MTSDGWQVLRIEDEEPIPVAGVHWRPLRRTLDVRAFGINAYSADAGADVVEHHSEEQLGHEEVYLVHAGRATFTLGEETVDAPAGTVVFVRDPAVRRHARAEEDGTVVLAIGGKAGEAYRPSAWEAYFATERHRAAGDHAAAIAELEQALAEHPDHPGVVYSLGCWYALAGRPDEALAQVRRSIELDPKVADWARRDDDLLSIRDRL